jgi:phosphoglucosamine mutase
MVQTGAPLADLAAVVQRLPQTLVNVRVSDRETVVGSPRVRDVLTDATAELGDTGRVLLRPSGTEPLVRVMVEAATQQQADTVAERIATAVRGC